MSTSGPAQDSPMPDQPLSHGYSIEGLTEPGQFDNEPAFPGINLNENMELAFKNVFNDMIDHFEKAQSEAAEALAHQLISWARLPILYRVYSHVILAHGPVDRLYHACKAIEQAQRGIQRHGDENGVGTQLLDIAQRTLKEVNDDAAAAKNEGNDQGEEQVGEQEMTSTEHETEIPIVEKEKVGGMTKSQETGEEEGPMSYAEEAELFLKKKTPQTVMSRASTSAPQNEGDEMLLDAPYSGIVSDPTVQKDTVATSQPGESARVSFTSQQQTKTASGQTELARTISSTTNVTRTSSSTTAPTRTTSGSTNAPSRAASNTTAITDFSSQGDRAYNIATDQEGEPVGTEQEGGDVSAADRKKRDRSDSSEEADQPAKKKTDK
ncbi:hypothetical protein D6C85_00581 [Aureobasidium pullulans]|uniref:Uncharacterized protein n=1 Tax=Aureobasidium pullulans TaxID=5580 RepID=A0A4S9XJU8_AURPU|nr:hypothetical protein D6C85_00581 [Aureobasidium pullulans]